MEPKTKPEKTLPAAMATRRYWLERMKLAKTENEVRAVFIQLLEVACLELIDTGVDAVGDGSGE